VGGKKPLISEKNNEESNPRKGKLGQIDISSWYIPLLTYRRVILDLMEGNWICYCSLRMVVMKCKEKV
jgi:hypothetical protein